MRRRQRARAGIVTAQRARNRGQSRTGPRRPGSGGGFTVSGLRVGDTVSTAGFPPGFGFGGGGGGPVPGGLPFGIPCPTGVPQWICNLGGSAIERWTGGSGGGGSNLPTTCPPRTVWDPQADMCVAPGSPADIGTGGIVPGHGGQAVAGSFGLPAVTPTVEQRVHRSCGKGFVLGDDNLCYPKAVLPSRSKFRKWRAAPKPAVSAADMRIARKYKTVQNRLKGIAGDVGLSTKKR